MPVRFVLIGYLDVEHGPWQIGRRALHRARPLRDRATCRACFAHYRVALVLYPSAGPETFSYTLSEAWSAGMPVLVPPIGALAERVRGKRRGLGDDRRRVARRARDARARLRADCGLAGCGGRIAARRRRARPRVAAGDAEGDGGRNVGYLRRCAGGASPRPSCIDRSSARESATRSATALGSRPRSSRRLWRSLTSRQQPGLVSHIARQALAIRHTALGRALYRLTPQTLLDALKSRLTS